MNQTFESALDWCLRESEGVLEDEEEAGSGAVDGGNLPPTFEAFRKEIVSCTNLHVGQRRASYI